MDKKDIPRETETQHIDDMVQSLKTSFGGDGTVNVIDDIEDDTVNSITDEDIQNELKKLFGNEISHQQELDDSEYALDADFLKEINTSSHDKKRKKSISEKSELPDLTVETPTEVIVENTETTQALEKSEETEETEEIERIEDKISDDLEIEDEIEWENNLEEELIPLSEVADISEMLSEIEEDTDNGNGGFGELLEAFLSERDNSELLSDMDEDDEDEIVEVEEIEEPVMIPIDISDMLSVDSKESLEEQVVLMHTEEQEKAIENDNRVELDNSAIELLLQLGCKDELENAIGEEGVDEYYASGDAEPIELANTYAYNGEEYVSKEQNEEINARYKVAYKSSLIYRNYC